MTGKTFIPNFLIKLDQEQDRVMLNEFLVAKNPTIAQAMPQLKTPSDVDDAINFVYGNWRGRLDEVVNWLQENTPTLENIALEISQLLDCNWREDARVTIYPSVCPVCPRDITNSSFMVNYVMAKNTLLKVVAHEMIHFLYFQKLRSLTKETIDTEYPGFDWLLSEIVAPLLVNEPTIQAIVHEGDWLYVPDYSVITDHQLHQIEELFVREKNLLQFRQQVQKIIGASSPVVATS